MRQNLGRLELNPTTSDNDPRAGQDAKVESLATRNVLPVVTQRKPGSEALGVAGGVAVVGLAGILTLWTMNQSRQSAVAPAPQVVQTPQKPVQVETAPPVPDQVITPIDQAPPPPPQPVLDAKAQQQAAAAPAANPLATPTIIFDASALPPPSGGAGAVATPGGTPNEEFAARIGGVGGATAVATAGMNPQTTVTQGTLIPAVLETAIDTDVPGFVRAVVSADVRGFDGSRVMIPRSSRLIGQYKSGMQAGQRRAYVIWLRVVRPDGVSVNIASPAISFGGETGLAGKVDNHFFERFGSAMLLSVVGGLSAAGNSSTAVIVGGQTQSAAAAAVGQSGQIPPTIRVRQGEPIRVFTARDLDFSKVLTQ